MTLDQAVTDAVAVAVHQALDQYVPPVAVGVTDAARALGVGETTVRDLVASGHLPTVPHVGRRTVIAVAALERFAQQSMNTTAAGSDPAAA